MCIRDRLDEDHEELLDEEELELLKEPEDEELELLELSLIHI